MQYESFSWFFILIDHLRIFSKNGSSRFAQVYQQCEEIFSAITVGEIFNCQSAAKFESEIQNLFALGNIINIDSKLMMHAGRIRRITAISLIDAIIAASAIQFNLPVVTYNQKDFSKFADIKLYPL